LYISGNSGNQKIENEQQQIQRVLQMRKIEFELVDIMLPGNQNERTFMRERGKKKDGQRNVIPPQIFNGQEFRGDFDDFDIANEDDVLEEFLGLERLKPKIEPFKTGAVAPEVNKLKVGKLDIKEEETSSIKKELHISLPEEETSQVVEEDPVVVASPEVKEADQQQEEEVESAEIDSCDSDSKPAEESDSGVELDEEEKADDEEGEEEEGVEDDTEKADPSVECENSNNGGDGEVGDNKADEDDANRKIVLDEDLGVGDTGDESETDTEDFTDSEDDTVEYMDDGEPVRKCKRGFKILQNCKRFWKASYD